MNENLPSWSAFQQLVNKATSQKANVGFLPALTAPPIQMNVITEVIKRTFHIICYN